MTYAERLQESPEVLAYLETRGLTAASARSWRLGYVGNGPLPGHEDYAGRLAIPYLTRAGVTTIRYRVIPPLESKAKYLSSSGDPPRLFNPGALFERSTWIAISEGEIDAMTATECGIPTVGVQGVNAWEPHFARPFRGYKRVYILADGDPVDEKTGLRPGKELVRTIQKGLPEAVPFYMSEGEDVNSFVVKYGAAALRQKIGLDK